MLKARVVTALLLAAGLLGVLFLLPPLAATVVFALVAAIAAWEWAGLMRIDQPARFMFGGVVLLFCWQSFIAGDAAFLMLWGASTFFWLVPAPLWLRYKWSFAENDFVGYAVGVLLLVPTWAAMAALHARGPWVLIGIMALAWVADIAAYFTGRAFGRRKLAPSVSPGKTWEGVGGAIGGVLVYGAAVALVLGLAGMPLILGLLALLPLTGLTIIGDLFESLMKRQAGIKDSSNLLPGHGGVLDRIDSQLSLLPAAALILHWSGK